MNWKLHTRLKKNFLIIRKNQLKSAFKNPKTNVATLMKSFVILMRDLF